MEAISHAGTCLGILATDGVLLAAEKRVPSKLLDPVSTSEKIYRVTKFVFGFDAVFFGRVLSSSSLVILLLVWQASRLTRILLSSICGMRRSVTGCCTRLRFLWSSLSKICAI